MKASDLKRQRMSTNQIINEIFCFGRNMDSRCLSAVLLSWKCKTTTTRATISTSKSGKVFSSARVVATGAAERVPVQAKGAGDYPDLVEKDERQ